MTRAVLLACAALAACSRAPSPSAHLPLQPYRKIRSVRAVVAGTAATMLFDSGGGLTLISPALAARIGCTPWGRLSGWRMNGERLDVPQCTDVRIAVGDYEVVAPVVGVADVLQYLPKGAAPVDGSIALDLFAGRALTLDFARNVVTVESPASLAARTRGLAEGKLRIERQLQGAALDVHVGADGAHGPVWLQLDSGNGGVLLVSRAVAAELGLDPSRDRPQPGRVRLAGGVDVVGDFFVPDLVLDGNLGMPFLATRPITIDLAHARVWFGQPSARSSSPSASPQ